MAPQKSVPSRAPGAEHDHTLVSFDLVDAGKVLGELWTIFNKK